MDVFGSICETFEIVPYATDDSEWDAVQEVPPRSADLSCVYALLRSPPTGNLSSIQQREVKPLRLAYMQAYVAADAVLHSLGSQSFSNSLAWTLRLVSRHRRRYISMSSLY